MNSLPINTDILQKRMAIPAKLAELSYSNPDIALDLIRIWGEKRMPITPLFELITSHLKKEEVG